MLERVLAAAREARPDPQDAHRLLLAQQAITDHVAASLAPDELCARVLATLGETLGWTYGGIWRPDGEPSMLHCTALWHDPGAGPHVAAFADVRRRMAIAPGRGLTGRAYAFRRPAWVADVASDGNMPRHDHALRAGLTSAVAFPIALADDCAGVIEFFSEGIEEPDAQVAAMFATVGGQVAQYLERHRLQADESRRVEAILRAERDRAQRYLDVAGTMIVVLDAGGEVLLINRKGCAILERPEDELLGCDWFAVAVPDHERAMLRGGFDELMQGTGARSSGSRARCSPRAARCARSTGTTPSCTTPTARSPARCRRARTSRERQAAEQQVTYLAYHDTLTGLPNRRLLEEQLKLALATGAELASCCTSTSTASSWSTTRSAIVPATS